MKNSIAALLLFLIFSCGQKENPQTNSKINSTIKENAFVKITESKKVKASDIINSKYHTTSDTVIIKTENSIERKFDKKEFNKIINVHPEFFD